MSTVEQRVAGQVTTGNGARPPERPTRRLARAHWIALTLGLLAFLVNVAVLRDRSQVVRVAVARETIAPATEITGDLVRYVEVPADSPLASSMIDEAALSRDVLYARRQIVADEPLVLDAVVEDVPDDGQRSMSVPVPRERAAGGTLAVGDRVDVIYMADRPIYAVTDAEVLAIGEASGASAGGQGSEYHLVLAVDAAESLKLAAAIDSDKLDIVRATGAPGVPPGLDAPPPAPEPETPADDGEGTDGSDSTDSTDGGGG